MKKLPMFPSLCLCFASIKRLTLRYRAQMGCNYHGGGAVPFNLRQSKEDTQTCKNHYPWSQRADKRAWRLELVCSILLPYSWVSRKTKSAAQVPFATHWIIILPHVVSFQMVSVDELSGMTSFNRVSPHPCTSRGMIKQFKWRLI